jgi:transposase-like protein
VGHYERKLQTKAGEVRLKVPKLRAQTLETAIIERYRPRERLGVIPADTKLSPGPMTS